MKRHSWKKAMAGALVAVQMLSAFSLTAVANPVDLPSVAESTTSETEGPATETAPGPETGDLPQSVPQEGDTAQTETGIGEGEGEAPASTPETGEANGPNEGESQQQEPGEAEETEKETEKEPEKEPETPNPPLTGAGEETVPAKEEQPAQEAGTLPAPEVTAPALSVEPPLLFAPLVMDTKASDVTAFRAALEAGEDVTLTDNVTLPSDWEPVDYAGAFDGNGFTITVNGTPLFATFSGQAKNLILDGNVEASETMGAFAKKMTGGQLENSLSAAFVTATGSVSNACGFVGDFSGGIIRGCVSTGVLTPGRWGDQYGIADGGSGLEASFCYWKETGAKKAMQYGTVTDSMVLTEENQAEILSLLNQLAGRTEGFRFWEESGSWIAPSGAVSDGTAEVTLQWSAWEEAVEKAEGLQQETYTAFSWQPFSNALQEAKALPDMEFLTQSQLDTAVKQLEEAQSHLITQAAFTALKEVEEEASALSQEEYTQEFWASFAQTYREITNWIWRLEENGGSATEAEVLEKTEMLQAAMDRLVPVSWMEIATAEELEAVDGSGYYRLVADLTDYHGNASTLQGILDGNGHQITFGAGAAPLFDTINGKVKNLGLSGTVQGSGAFATMLNGTISNCYSWADVEGGAEIAGGLAGQAALLSAATIENTYVLGNVTGSDVGGFAGQWMGEALIVDHSFWVCGDAAVAGEAGEEESFGGAQKTKEELSTEAFRQALNEKRGTGSFWTKSEAGYPYFGTDFSAVGTFYPVQMKDLVTEEAQVLETSGTLTTDLFGLPDGDVAVLSLEGYEGDVQWSSRSTEQNAPVIVSRTGSVFVRGAGTVLVEAVDAQSGETIEQFSLQVEVPKNYTLYLYADGTDYTGGTYLFSGGAQISPYVSVDGGVPFEVYCGLFTWSSSDDDIVFVDSLGWVSVNEPGAAIITASLGKTKQQMTVSSQYIPVETITPAFSGTFSIHRRNPNSIGQNDTPGVASFNPLYLLDEMGEPIVSSAQKIAVVTSEDATYARSYGVETSDHSVLQYYASLQNNLVPKKPGTVTLTVTSNDPKLAQPVTGQSQVTIQYVNPLTSLTAKETTLTVKTGEEIDAGLVMTGPNSAPSAKYPDGLHVSESNMTWEQEGEGEISVYRSYPVIMIGDEAAYENEGTVSNDRWLIRGVKPGKVTLIGTPVDETYTGDPITLTVVVEEGETKPVLPAEEQVAEALQKTSAYQLSAISNPTFGHEWTMMALARAGYDLPENYVAQYEAHVLEKIKEEVAKESNRFEDKVTETQRLALALTALGVHPQKVGGVDLLDYSWNKEENFPGIKPDGTLGSRQGSNELIFALLATEAHDDFVPPSDATITQEEMVRRLLGEFQLADGGFGLYDKKTLSVDMTAMAVQALAKHLDETDAQAAVEAAVARLSLLQDTDGSFGNAVSTAQVIVALAELDIDPATDRRFVKNGFTLLDGLMNFALENGAFAHTVEGEANAMATEQAFYALVALSRLYAGESSLYRMNDVSWKEEGISVTGLVVTPQEATLSLGKTLTLQATVLPATATNQKVLWSSDTPEVADVDETGLVQAKAEGKAIITAQTEEGGFTVTIPITVTKKSGGGSGPSEGETKTVTLSIDKEPIGKGYVLAPTEVTMTPGETVWDVLQRELESRGISYRYSENSQYGSVYVEMIDGDGEFDHGPGSGWQYSVNGTYPDYGCSLYVLQGGETICWRYTTNLGAGLGGGAQGSGTAGSETVTLQKEIKPNLSGEVEVTLTEEEVAQALQQSSQSAMLYLPLLGEETYQKVILTMESEAVLRLYRQDKGLMVETPFLTIGWEAEEMAPWMETKETVQLTLSKDAETWTVEVLVDGAESTPSMAQIFVPGKFTSGQVFCLAQGEETQVVRQSVKTKTGLWANFLVPSVVTVEERGKDFLDIEETYWASDAIAFVSSRGLFYGTEEEIFSPGVYMTRGMLAAVLYRLAGEPDVAEGAAFTDVETGAWYEKAVSWAKENGVLAGEGDLFAPERPISREELAMAMVQMEAVLPVSFPKEGTLEAYEDRAEVSDWALEAMTVAVSAGIVSGKDETHLAPTNPATRAEVAAMVARMFDWMKQGSE